VPNSSSESEKETSETKTDDTGITKTDKKTNTKCEGAKCTTTTEETTTGPGGSSTTKTTTTEEPKQDYCQKNPKALECKADNEESSWGGSCESQFVCDGDAVQCAQAQAAWLTTCSLRTDRANSTVLAGNAAIDGTDRAGIEASLGKNQTTAFSLSSLISSNPVFGATGGCPGDSSVSVAGVSVTVPFSSLCGMFNQIGIALQGLAYLVAAFIVFRKGQ
jgi:hypothetical protein